MSEQIARYRRQSRITAVHPYEAEVDPLPKSVGALIEIVDGLVIHFETDKDQLDDQLIAQRKHEVDSRLASTMLDRIFSIDTSPLSQARPAERRLLGTCRDTAVLLCAFLRHHGWAARVRFGFAHMLHQRAKPLHNHAVVEYWNGDEWLLAESRMPYVRGSDVPFEAHEMPRELFTFGGEAWRQMINGERPAPAFTDYRLGEHPSAWLVRSFALYDLASLAGYEPLMWDQWGRHYNFSRPRRAFEDGALLDLLNDSMDTDCRIDAHCERIVDRFQEVTGIVDGTQIHSFSPVLGRYSVTV